MQLIWLSPHQDRLHWLPAAVTLRPSQMRSGWGFLVCKLFDGLKEMSSLPIREQDSYSFIFLFVSDLFVTMFVSFFIVDADMPFYVSFYQISTKMLNVHIDNLTCCFKLHLYRPELSITIHRKYLNIQAVRSIDHYIKNVLFCSFSFCFQ